MNDLFERIDKYHNNELSELERLLFEFEMEKDPKIKSLCNNSLLVESLLIDYKADEFGRNAFAYSKAKEAQKRYFIIISGILACTLLLGVYFLIKKQEEQPKIKRTVETKVSKKQKSTPTSIKNEIKRHEKPKSKNIIIESKKEDAKTEAINTNQIKPIEPEKILSLPAYNKNTDNKEVEYNIHTESLKIDNCKKTKITFDTHVSESCMGQEDGKIILLNIVGGKEPYMFALNDQDYKTNFKFENLASSNHTINIKDANGCTSSRIVQLKAKPCIKVNSYAIDPTIGEKVTLETARIGCEITIYNKIGILVFKSKIDKNNPIEWQGMSDSGEQLSEGVYLYTIECGSETIEKGYISISKSH